MEEIKICAQYQYIVPKASACLSGTPVPPFTNMV